jgi:hypothetical protein
LRVTIPHLLVARSSTTQPSAKQTVPIIDVIAPASIDDFIVSRHICSQAGTYAVAENVPVHSGLSDIRLSDIG